MSTDIEKLLTMAKDCEIGMKNSYDRFSQAFEDHERPSQMWKKFSNDESEHIELIDDLLRAMSPAQKNTKAEFSQVDPIEKQIEFMRDNPHAEVTTIEEALSYTKKLEEYEVSSIIQLLMKGYFPKKEKNELLHKKLVEHYAELLRYFEEVST